MNIKEILLQWIANFLIKRLPMLPEQKNLQLTKKHTLILRTQGYAPIGLEEVFVIKKVKNTIP